MARRTHGSDGKLTRTPSFSSAATIGSSWQRSRGSGPTQPEPLSAGLYIVATPIGNIGDITVRALDTLRRVDVIACEDTRVTAKLLRAYEITTPTTPYHDHNAARVRPRLIKRLQDGETMALVTDAGTPLIADPGFKLAQAVVAAGIAITTLPGASGALAALTVSALPTDRFLFAGFLPPKLAGRRAALAVVSDAPASLIFYESPRRLAASLADMAQILGDRPAAVARELTKLHEEVRRDGLAVLAAHYATAPPPRGEVVIIVGPPAADPLSVDDATLDAMLRAALTTSSLRDAAAAVAVAAGRRRRDVYARALTLVGKAADDD